MLYKNLILFTCNCCLIWFCPKSDPKKYECVLKGSFNTIMSYISSFIDFLNKSS